MSNFVRIQGALDPRMRVQRARVQRNQGSFDLIVRFAEGPDADEDCIDLENFSGDEDLTVRRDLLAMPLPAPQELEAEEPSHHSFVASTGARLDKYQLGRRLGEGSFGVVFAARDTTLGRDVAIKLLTAQHAYDPQILARFLQEATAAARITHPGIVTMFDCGHTGGTAYIAMELLKGETLTNRLARSGRLAPDIAMELVRQIASALEAAHHAGVVHRDLKPDNIFLVPDPAVPSGERVKILDFGLAKLRDQASRHTQARIVFGTPRYMSPEQTRSAAKADHRSDIYALGCILFELVCGQPPFAGEMMDVVEQHQHMRAPRARAFMPALPDKLDRLIGEMLAKAPDERPQTMAAVQRALQGIGALAPGAAATMLPTVLAEIAHDMFEPEAPAPRPLPLPGARRRADQSARSSRIEHTLPWGKLDLDPEIIVTSAAPPRAARGTRPPRGQAPPATVLHAPPQTSATDLAPADDDLAADITVDIAPRRRAGLITGVLATLVAAAVLLTVSLVQRHAHAPASAIHATAPATR